MRSYGDVISKISGYINIDKQYPDSVFIGDWNEFFFFDSDWVFDVNFVEVMKTVLLYEGSREICIVNLDSDLSNIIPGKSIFCINKDTLSEEYRNVLTGGSSQSGWVHYIDRFGCASDVGTWSLYCERRNELAVLAMKNEISQDTRSVLISAFKAKTIREGIEESYIYGLSDGALTEEWKEALILHYEK